MAWKDVDGNELSGEKINFTTFTEGVNTIIRIIEDEPFSRWVHWLQSYKRSITCPGKGCPICNIIKEMKENKEKPKYNSSKRHALRIINRNTNEVEILEQSSTFFSQLLSYHEEIGDLKNYDIKVIRKGTGTDTQYTLIPLAPKPLSDEDKALIENSIVVDFPDFFKAPTMEQVLMFLQEKPIEEIYKNNQEEEISTE